MSIPIRVQIYRDVAQQLRELLATVSAPAIRADMEAKARRYDQLAEGIEMANFEIRQVQR